MNLRDQAEKDLAMTLEDSEFGFGKEATVTNPAGISKILNIQSGDVHLLFLPKTDITVNAQTAHATIRIKSLFDAGLGIPRVEPDENKNPWIIEFKDAQGVLKKFTVSEPQPDHTLGIITIILELITN